MWLHGDLHPLNVLVHDGALAGVIDFGDLTVTGTGGAREVFRRVRDPIAFRNHVQQASIPTGQGPAPKRPE